VVSAQPPPAVSTQPPPINPKPAARCDPPFDLDERGQKIFKPECFR
jgi:hypothetical protein